MAWSKPQKTSLPCLPFRYVWSLITYLYRYIERSFNRVRGRSQRFDAMLMKQPCGRCLIIYVTVTLKVEIVVVPMFEADPDSSNHYLVFCSCINK